MPSAHERLLVDIGRIDLDTLIELVEVEASAKRIASV
jgi:hypothetical protein